LNIFNLSSREIGLLIYLAQQHAIDRTIEITTTEVAEVFNISQQSASRSLLQLESEGYIDWNSSPTGSKVRLLQKGVDTLHKLRFELERAIHPDLSSLVLTGIVFTGLGEGKYYMTKANYVSSFKSELGFVPYPGTLNIRISSDYIKNLDLIRGSFPKIIKGFEEEGRSFGDVLCYPVKIFNSDVKAAIIVPSRTHYGRNIAEIVSDVNIREKFGLRDGDKITVYYLLKDGTRSK